MTLAQGIQASLIKSITSHSGLTAAQAATELKLCRQVSKQLGLTLAEVLQHSNLVAKS